MHREVGRANDLSAPLYQATSSPSKLSDILVAGNRHLILNIAMRNLFLPIHEGK
jgi:hypothetical protein